MFEKNSTVQSLFRKLSIPLTTTFLSAAEPDLVHNLRSSVCSNSPDVSETSNSVSPVNLKQIAPLSSQTNDLGQEFIIPKIDLNQAYFGSAKPVKLKDNEVERDCAQVSYDQGAYDQFAMEQRFTFDKQKVAVSQDNQFPDAINISLSHDLGEQLKFSDIVYFSEKPQGLATQNSYLTRTDVISQSFDQHTSAYAVTAGLLGLTFLLDGTISSDQNLFSDVGNLLGDKQGVLAFTLAPMLFAEITGNQELGKAAITATESAVYAGLVTQLVKELSGRSRPDGSDNVSFFSGHTSFVASIAGSYSETHNWDPKVAIPLHALAAITAYARVATDNHHESDVLWGYAVGWGIGVLNAKFRKEVYSPLSLEPCVDAEASGVMLTYRF